MILKNIKLKNFRNYNDLLLDFSGKKTLLIGKNAQGKTNILDAIYYLSCLHSLNAKTDSELVKWGETKATISAMVINDNIENELNITIETGKKKILKVNEIKKTKSADFISKLSVVSFSITDLLLLRGTPDDRRNWLDNAICQIYPVYSDRISKYNKIRIQKNNYLKAVKSGKPLDKELLSVWNTQLVTSGSNIIYLRIKFLKELQKIALLKHSAISGVEKLNITYDSGILGTIDTENNNVPDIDKIVNKFEEAVAEHNEEELIRAQCVVGPHRDDISYFINSTDAKKFASQGQQRTVVLALKLAELELIETKISTTPILLLDDVLAELDDIRQNFLLNSINSKIQTIITSVDTLHFNTSYLENVEIFTVKNGTVKKENIE